MISKNTIEQLFMALDKNIKYYKGEDISLVVCGGTALFVMDLISRTTNDVDVIGELKIHKGKKEVKEFKKFPDWFVKSAAAVARDFNLQEDWINLGPASRLRTGLPHGLTGRLTAKKYGKFLTVYYIGRIDQVYFKLYASLDRGGYHVDDFFALKPTENEIRDAVKWVLTQDVSEGFLMILKDFLEKHNFSDIAHEI